VRIARTDLVNFMIDDLVESSLGFLKRKEKKNKKKKIRDLAISRLYYWRVFYALSI